MRVHFEIDTFRMLLLLRSASWLNNLSFKFYKFLRCSLSDWIRDNINEFLYGSGQAIM